MAFVKVLVRADTYIGEKHCGTSVTVVLKPFFRVPTEKVLKDFPKKGCRVVLSMTDKHVSEEYKSLVNQGATKLRGAW